MWDISMARRRDKGKARKWGGGGVWYAENTHLSSWLQQLSRLLNCIL